MHLVQNFFRHFVQIICFDFRYFCVFFSGFFSKKVLTNFPKRDIMKGEPCAETPRSGCPRQLCNLHKREVKNLCNFYLCNLHKNLGKRD